MYTSRKKIHKDKNAEPTEFEESVGQAIFDLETNSDLKSELKDLYINSAVQVDVAGNRKAVVIHIPYRLRKAYRKIHVRLVRELEKKFSGKDVVLIATRRIVRPPKKGSAVQRPRTRTLTAVHEAMLEDVVLPAEIVGKRTRYRLDGSKIMKAKNLIPKRRFCYEDVQRLPMEWMNCERSTFRFSWIPRNETTRSTSWRAFLQFTGSFQEKMLYLSTQ
ncbi:hypothetical protein PRUPE_3G016800 [Prunus persica]|uniref:40S ribosomal protein S7 n=1 Tax=Prunus persica TaxID=3760 RepID=A0A251PTM7_PRUPE|nr:hypothetical protein PRUPE_3G016800 [Prunus persica]ONI14935.1 hypothetical protein PRUPE_3G016800 [Prunus persica]